MKRKDQTLPMNRGRPDRWLRTLTVERGSGPRVSVDRRTEAMFALLRRAPGITTK